MDNTQIIYYTQASRTSAQKRSEQQNNENQAKKAYTSTV